MDGAGKILVVCGANVCQSPYIERLLAARLCGLDIDVSSAGTAALAGRPMAKDAARLLRQAGANADGFVARQVTPRMVLEADLVLTTTRAVRHEVVRLEPKALRHTHAIVDFGDLVAAADLGRPAMLEEPDATLVGKLTARAVTGRGQVAARFAAESGIVDPFRRRSSVFVAMARQVAEILPRLVTAAHEVAVVDQRMWLSELTAPGSAGF